MAKHPNLQNPVTFTVTVDGNLARIFEEICLEEGKRPEEMLLRAVRTHVGRYLDSVAHQQDPSSVRLIGAVHKLAETCSRKALGHALGMDRWPWVSTGAPTSLKAAKAAAARRGKLQAAKFAKQDLVLRASKVGAR